MRKIASSSNGNPEAQMASEESSFALGDYSWVKVKKHSWWPAQIVDENTISKKCIPNRKTSAGTLARLYGTYIYLYVDIQKCHSEFQDILEKKKYHARVEFQKSLEKHTFGLQKCSNLKRDLDTSEGHSKKQRPAEVSPGKSRDKHKAMERSETDPTVTKTPRNGKNSTCEGSGKMSGAKNINMTRTPESTRRIKVMQSLGLIAPSGSPFGNGLTPRR